MRYEIIGITEDDYGCEGIPENEELMCTVLLRGENGSEKQIRLADSFLSENGIEKGSHLFMEEI
ncbi:MAG: hypothetical protein IKH78_04495 [Ruminococcus sp.]|nr:hypothetical protein [Ruminococcus sp.]